MINDREEEEEEEEDFRDSIVQETVGTEWDAAETAFVVLQESTLTITKTRWHACALPRAYKTNALDSVIIVNQR
jgi:hypothetical protein